MTAHELKHLLNAPHDLTFGSGSLDPGIGFASKSMKAQGGGTG